MTVFGSLVGIVGSDIETGQPRFTFGITELFDGIEIVALALGMFGIAEFMNSINNTETVDMRYAKVGLSDMFPSKADLKKSFFPDDPRHADRQPLRADPWHRTDDCLVRLLPPPKRKYRRHRSASGTARSRAWPALKLRRTPPCRATSFRP